MAKSRFRKPVYFATTASAAATFCINHAVATTASIPTLVIDTAVTLPAQQTFWGTGSHADATAKAKGVYLSYSISGTGSASLTHGLGGVIKGWLVTNRTTGVASGNIIYCSDISTSTTTLTLCSLGTTVFKVFAFT